MTQAATLPLPTLPTAPGERLALAGLEGSGLALLLALAARDRPLLAITDGTLRAEHLAEGIRFYAGPELPVQVFPDWETLPYDQFSPHPDITSQRLAALYALPAMRRGVIIAPVSTLLLRLPPRAFLDAHGLVLKKGQRFDLDEARQRLERAGYRCVSQVMAHGEFAVRGALLDLFPSGSDTPLRIDLLDDEIESIRLFDPESQRTTAKQDTVRLLPAREFPLHQEGIERFRQSFRREFPGNPQHCPLYRDVSRGHAPGGVEWFLPLFFEDCGTLFDYLPRSVLLAEDGGALDAVPAVLAQAAERYEQLRHDVEHPILPPSRVMLEAEALHAALAALPLLRAQRTAAGGDTAHPWHLDAPPSLAPAPRASDLNAPLRQFLHGHGGPVLFVAESAGSREALRQRLESLGVHAAAVSGWPEFIRRQPPHALCAAVLEEGLLLREPPLAVITETQLHGRRAAQARRRKRPQRSPEQMLSELSNLRPGSPVVHEQHGVGRYQGLVKLDTGGQQGEFLCLEYQDGDKLYVPVTQLHLVNRYSGAPEQSAPLHKLGGGDWARAKRKAAEKARDAAAELLAIHARRQARAGHAFALDPLQYAQFAEAFPFEETPDQAAAIAAVIGDLTAARPMDRVVCGDVGFGKTEVALRAAFVAAQGGRQVALLAPTTLLAQQHYQNFRDRLADWPLRVEMLSRFRARKEVDATLAALAEGAVDIVIGTHKLLQKGVRYRNLGLVIVDEEHRFGVRDKEALKALRAEVDILTLTATPIPRTLNMALAGLRELSLIATPPEHRLAVKTFVAEWRDALVREACERELKRGGQVYVLHNDVDTIARAADSLRALLPQARVAYAHGQMRERELEQVMLDFYHRRFDVLVCTTIIESGIDVPTANTILIERADKLGLAQLHQLRGRVGRSHHQAYCYLLVPDRKALSGDASKRLEAIEGLEDLGAGFVLATHDLEIRGAGELLGEEQSGAMEETGFTLYTQMLERAVRSLKAGKLPDLEATDAGLPEVELRLPALIPDDYLPDVHARLILYKRIASAADAAALEQLQIEMVDRFGPLPESARHLFRLSALRLHAQTLGIRKLEAGAQGGKVHFHEQPNINAAALIQLIQTQPKAWKLDGPAALRCLLPLPSPELRFQTFEDLLTRLTPAATP